MTAPSPSILQTGGRSVTVGATPVLLTEYAPVTVINLSPDSRVWLASSSSVSSGSGVPLDPGTAYNWQTAGPLYAIVDPGAAAAQLVLTGSGTEWSPSPTAIASAVAAQLVEQGIPSKLLVDKIGTFTVGSNFTVPADLTGYSSIYLVITDVNGTHALQYEWYNGDNVVGSLDAIYPDPSSNAQTILTVLGPTLMLYPYPGETWDVTIYGYNRQLPALQPEWGAVWTGTATPAQTTVALNLTSGSIPSTGLCACYLQAYPLPDVQNRVQLQTTYIHGSSVPNLILQDYTLPAAGTGIFLPFQTVFPPANNYAPVIRLFSTLTQNCDLTLHTVQSQW